MTLTPTQFDLLIHYLDMREQRNRARAQCTDGGDNSHYQAACESYYKALGELRAELVAEEEGGKKA